MTKDAHSEAPYALPAADMVTTLDAGKAEENWEERVNAASLDDYIPGSPEEKKMLRKIDLRIVPTIWILYFASYLDRSNIANARTGGMEEDFNLTDNQYSIMVLVFFISYVLFEVPSNMILTRVRPSIYLSALCFIWGGVSTCQGAAQNWRDFTGLRFCLGICEAGFAPGIIFYLSAWYRKHEVARRYCIYYSATAISGAVSGLIAGVVTDHMDGIQGLEGWRWLLIIEGIFACALAAITWMVLPDFPSTTKWLSREDQDLAAKRLLSDNLGSTGDQENQPTHKEALIDCFTDWRVWYLSVMYMLATGSQTIQYFLPALMANLGYNSIDAQYMTIPVYMVTAFFILTCCFLSDLTKERGHWLTFTSGLAVVSFIIIMALGTSSPKVQLAFISFGMGGIYASCPLVLMWTANLISFPSEKRAIAAAFVNSMGSSANIYGSFLWDKKTAPTYRVGFGCCIAFAFLLCCAAQLLRYLDRKYPYSIEARNTAALRSQANQSEIEPSPVHPVK